MTADLIRKAITDLERLLASLDPPPPSEKPTTLPARSVGIYCPSCMVRMECKRVKQVKGQIRRERMCPCCGARVHTYEVAMGPFAAPK